MKMIKILVVEDEKPISDLIKLSLGKLGYSCDCAFDGMTAAVNIIPDGGSVCRRPGARRLARRRF